MRILKSDTEFEIKVVTEICKEKDGYSLTFSDGLSLSCPLYSSKPRIGSIVRLYGKGFGYNARGIVIDGVIVRYRTVKGEARYNKQQVALERRRKIQEFRLNRADRDRRIAALPDIFRKRIRWFQLKGKDFRWDLESYELFCCEEAVKIINYVNKRKVDAEQALEIIEKARNSKRLQKAIRLDMGSHSGNTFGTALSLAKADVSDRWRIMWMHGAMAALTGCQAYGCHGE